MALEFLQRLFIYMSVEEKKPKPNLFLHFFPARLLFSPKILTSFLALTFLFAFPKYFRKGKMKKVQQKSTLILSVFVLYVYIWCKMKEKILKRIDGFFAKILNCIT